MKKVLIVTFLMYLFTSCSNIETISEQKGAETLKVFVGELRANLEGKNLSFLEGNMLETRRNEYIYQELQKIDILDENIQVYVNEPNYVFPKTQGIVGVQYHDRMEYFTIFYEWKDGRWFISNLEERR